jgi:hypothetical protein
MNIKLARLDIKDKFLHCLSATCNMAFGVLFILYMGHLYASAIAVLARKFAATENTKFSSTDQLMSSTIAVCSSGDAARFVVILKQQTKYMPVVNNIYFMQIQIQPHVSAIHLANIRLHTIIKRILYIGIRIIERISIVDIKFYLFIFL